jgi:hypothetical protein
VESIVVGIVRLITAVTFLTAGATSGLPARGGDEPGHEQITAWIEHLGSPQYARREAASKSLLAAGRPAIAPLAAAIETGDLEVASRGIEILGGMLADETLADAAEAALEHAAEKARPSVARLAESALDFHHLGQAAVAREALASLGAAFHERPVVEQAGLEVELGRDWKGTSDDLRQLARLPRLEAVLVHGVRLDDEAVAVLGRLRGIKRLELFGTGLAEKVIDQLAGRLPEVSFDVRRGGKLGVGALAFGGPCEIQTVEPGSAADQAGVRPGDVVVAVDGVVVDDFEGLTDRVAGRGPGERIRLTVARRGGDPSGDAETLDLEIRLDAW